MEKVVDVKKKKIITILVSCIIIICILLGFIFWNEGKVDRLIKELYPRDITEDFTENMSRYQKAAEELAKIGSDEVVEKLTEALITKGGNIFVVPALQKIKGTEYLIGLMMDQSLDADLRLFIGESLSLARRDEAVDPFISLIKDKNISVAAGAINSLGSMGSKKAVIPILQILSDTPLDTVPDNILRWNAAVALARIGDKEAFPVLIDLLSSSFVKDRIIVARVMGIFGDKEAVPALISSLSDPNERVRMNAATSLGQLGDEMAVESLSKASKDDPSELVRKTASDALNKIREAGSQSDVQ